MTEPTTAEGRALLEDGIDRFDLKRAILAIEAAAAEAERARIRAAVQGIIGWDDIRVPGLVRRAAVLAAIDALGTGETLHERQVRLNYERPGRAAIDDEAKG